MGSQLKEQLARSLFRFKKVNVHFPPALDIHMGELFLMNKLVKNTSESDSHATTAELQKKLFVSKPAVSQMYKSLEKKGYIYRETDKNDRRKVVVTLTPKGHEILQQVKEYFDDRLAEIITQFGEENTIQLIELFNRFADISESLNKGDEQHE